jgi:hypothetical protein
MKSRTYYRVRSVVRFLFWSAVMLGITAVVVRLIVAYWDWQGM